MNKGNILLILVGAVVATIIYQLATADTSKIKLKKDVNITAIPR
jgi:hypothetical protein